MVLGIVICIVIIHHILGWVFIKVIREYIITFFRVNY